MKYRVVFTPDHPVEVPIGEAPDIETAQAIARQFLVNAVMRFLHQESRRTSLDRGEGASREMAELGSQIHWTRNEESGAVEGLGDDQGVIAFSPEFAIFRIEPLAESEAS